MDDELQEIAEAADNALHLLLSAGIQRRSLEETDEYQKKTTIDFLRSVSKQASEGELHHSLEAKAEEMAASYEVLPPNEREPAFRCISSYKACMGEASNTREKVLCGIALAICFSKEVIPLA